MESKTLGWLAAVELMLVALWVIMLVPYSANAGEIATLDDAVALVDDPGALYYPTYINAVLFTVGATVFMVGLYTTLQGDAPVWTLVGVMFVPVYALCNLFAYASQITVVPALVDVYESDPDAELLLGQMVQMWPDSVVAFINGLGYAVLGIPSIIFGAVLYQKHPVFRAAGALLAASGVASIVGIAGMVVGSDALMMGTLIGGLVFLIALIALTWSLFRPASAPVPAG
ncbi:MAG: hypothetical protein GYB65_14855 [Chloroflexi bacterium]|nr:hypothetical protein [Chloroflexota bacterium]